MFGIYDVNRLSYLSCLIDQDMGISLKFVLRRSILRLMLLIVVERSIVKIDAFVCFVWEDQFELMLLDVFNMMVMLNLALLGIGRCFGNSQ